MNNSKITNIFTKIFLAIYIMFSIGLYLASIKYNHSVKFLMLYLVELLVFIVFIRFKKFFLNILKQKISKKFLFPLIIIIGVLLRIAIIFIDYQPLPDSGDYHTFFYNASTFCESNTIASKFYVELFPYLIPYMCILGIFFKLTNISYQSMVILNVILDLCIPLFLYFIFENTNVRKTTVSLWLFNPINIIWCMICSPIVLVNFGIALSILVFSKILKHIDSKIFILYSILTGIIMGFANTFRPLMPIMLIAILLYFIYIILTDKKFIAQYIISFILITISFFSIKYLSYGIMNKIIDGNVSTTSGWTLFLGSNIENSGMWYNSAETDAIFNKDLSAEEIQQEFKELAFSRYKSNGLNNIILFIRKLFILTGNIGESSFQTLLSTAKINNEILTKIFRILVHLYINFLVLLNASNVIFDVKYNKLDKFDIFYMLLYIGIITAHIFVEVHPRYYMPAMVPLTIIAGLSLHKILTLKKEV